MSAVNRNASEFLSLVARQFDERYFPGVEPLPVFKRAEDGVFSSPTMMDRLPTTIQTMVHVNTSNFSQWLQSTRLLEPPLENTGRESVRKTSMEESAKELLLKLRQPLGHFKPYSEQLLTFVFQQAFNRVEGDTRIDERESIILLAAKLQPALDRLPLTYRGMKYRVESIFARALNHTATKIVLTYGAYKIGQWVQPRLYHLLSQTIIPRGVNYLINHAHLSVIRVVSGGVALVQFACFHYWKTSLYFYAAKLASERIHPWLKRTVVAVETFVFFPSKVISWLVMSPFGLLTSSWQMHSSFAASLNTTVKRDRAQYYQEGGMKAHRTWMELMQCGIKGYLKN